MAREALTRKCIELALAGDTVALKMAMERIVPPRRERPIAFALPAIKTTEDLPKVTAALLAAVADGELALGEAVALAKLVEAHRHTADPPPPAVDFREMLRREAEAYQLFGPRPPAANGAAHEEAD